VWTSKTSDIVRCLLKRDSPTTPPWARRRHQGAALLPADCGAGADQEVFSVRCRHGTTTVCSALDRCEPYTFIACSRPCSGGRNGLSMRMCFRLQDCFRGIHPACHQASRGVQKHALDEQAGLQMMASLPTLYKAAHAFLVSRKPAATDGATSVPLHALLRALRAPFCSSAQWATHPGLRSAPILLKFLKNDTALAIGAADGDKADHAPLHLNKYHNSYRTALKAMESGGIAADSIGAAASSSAFYVSSRLASKVVYALVATTVIVPL
jgi:hypothetical protein